MAHYATPARRAEDELSPQAQARFAACTASLRGDELERAYAAAWRWAGELHGALAVRYDLTLPAALLASIEARFAIPVGRSTHDPQTEDC